jgi:hypothetical protein
MELTWLGHSCFRLRGKDATSSPIPLPLHRLLAASPPTSSPLVTTIPGITMSRLWRRAAYRLRPGEYETSRC